MKSTPFKVALLGNPNSGKSSLFNALTGLKQKISNYPGVTVDKKHGLVKIGDETQIEFIDFPGIYSLYPNSSDEKIVVEILSNVKDSDYPDGIIYVASSIELEKHFLLATQLKELGLPMIVCLTMADLSAEKEIKYDLNLLADYLDCPVVDISNLTGYNLEKLQLELLRVLKDKSPSAWSHRYSPGKEEQEVIEKIKIETSGQNDYQNLLIAHHFDWLSHLSPESKVKILAITGDYRFNSLQHQIRETLDRFDRFGPVLQKSKVSDKSASVSFTEKIDNILTHKLLGPIIFFLLMFLVFQAIYAWAEWPMTWIEGLFTTTSVWVKELLPGGWFTNLLTDGILAGLGGIMVFIPQIAILFLLISLLEEVGYMSRAVFMFDSVMQKFGLNGRSVVALISGAACAIPAIMSTRTIANWKERLITILVTPLISCSARIPVYTILIGFVVPPISIGGFVNAQGLAFMGLYLLGILIALVSALFFKYMLKSRDQSFLALELPSYKKPIFRNVFFTVKEKVVTFITEAGQVILVISIILWFLASYGPNRSMELAQEEAISLSTDGSLDETETENLIASKRLEASYAGVFGKFIEPAIEPLGFDWKIGIALITSFAAREVFVGTMATIYSVGNTEDELTLRQKMTAEVNSKTGQKRFDLATSLSLLLFYVFALQCMSTLAITKRETKSWKWPIVQFVFMGLLAYLSSFAAYQLIN